jgi:hypothetical protein
LEQAHKSNVHAEIVRIVDVVVLMRVFTMKDFFAREETFRISCMDDWESSTGVLCMLDTAKCDGAKDVFEEIYF